MKEERRKFKSNSAKYKVTNYPLNQSHNFLEEMQSQKQYNFLWNKTNTKKRYTTVPKTFYTKQLNH